VELTTLTFNLGNSPIRHETLQGRNYLVAPMAMLTEGVHTGSGGALLYQAKDMQRAVGAWNMRPVVVYHPTINGQGVSACDPDVLEGQQVGMVLNTRWDGKLRAEAWIDEQLAAKVDPRVLDALDENKPMEVSTGLFTDNVATPGDWNGTPYDAIATNHQPDHLALLPDKIGACSVADGAGLCVWNEHAQAAGVDVTHLLARELDALRKMVGNAMSHGDIHSALATALREHVGMGTVDDMVGGPWIVDIYKTTFVYEHNSKLYRLGYKATAKVVTLSADAPQEVVRVTEYRASEDVVGNTAPQEKENATMDRTAIIAALIANVATSWGEDDRATLEAMDDDLLGKLSPIENTETPVVEESTAVAPVAEVVANAAPVDLAGYIANAPPQLRDVLTNAVASHESAKTGLIAQITANAQNTFSPEFLGGKGLAELQGLAALATTPATVQVPAAAAPMFIGQATAPGVPVANAGDDEEPLLAPTMNFGQEDK